MKNEKRKEKIDKRKMKRENRKEKIEKRRLIMNSELQTSVLRLAVSAQRMMSEEPCMTKDENKNYSQLSTINRQKSISKKTKKA